MDSLSPSKVQGSLQLLAGLAAAQEEELNNYSKETVHSDSEEEDDTNCPIFRSFYNDGGGAKAIMNMTNFSTCEFRRLWRVVDGFVSANWNIGRGRKCLYCPRDILFMTLTTIKYGGQWDVLARIFSIKTPTFERVIMQFIKLTGPFLYKHFVTDIEGEEDLQRLYQNNILFKNFPCARYATDVRFQQSNRPSGTMQEGKVYYSGKHKLYGIKQEISVNASGLAIMCTQHYPGSSADIDIMHLHAAAHTRMLKKHKGEELIVDVANFVDDHDNSWAVLCDKGYQGAREFVRAIHPKKTPQLGHLTTQDVAYNKAVSSDRIIVENYFGCLCQL